MKAITYFLVAVVVAGGCRSGASEPVARPQAVRAVQVRRGPVVEGRSHLAEVVPAQAVRVLAQVPGTVSEVGVEEGVAVPAGTPLVRLAAPDVSARVSRVRAERERAETERDFACGQLATDRVLAAAGDLPSVKLDQSEKGCSLAELAVQAATAAEREALVASTRAVERAPFDGEVLAQLVDVGQAVMPGAALLQYGSRERRLRVRLPQGDLARVPAGTRVESELGSGRVVEIGAQASGPGRLVEVSIALDPPAPDVRVGTTVPATLVLAERPDAVAVPEEALGRDEAGPYVLVIEDDELRRIEVQPGPRQDGWIAVEPPLSEGTWVVSGSVGALVLDRPVLAVAR